MKTLVQVALAFLAALLVVIAHAFYHSGFDKPTGGKSYVQVPVIAPGECDNANHPELRDGEEWLTNDSLEGFLEIGWASKRMGSIACGSDKNQIIGLAPVFVAKDKGSYIWVLGSDGVVEKQDVKP